MHTSAPGKFNGKCDAMVDMTSNDL